MALLEIDDPNRVPDYYASGVMLDPRGLILTNFHAVRDANLQIADGEFLVLVGPSGCGKTTALRMVAGLEDISDGTLSIGGRVVNIGRRFVEGPVQELLLSIVALVVSVLSPWSAFASNGRSK